MICLSGKKILIKTRWGQERMPTGCSTAWQFLSPSLTAASAKHSRGLTGFHSGVSTFARGCVGWMYHTHVPAGLLCHYFTLVYGGDMPREVVRPPALPGPSVSIRAGIWTPSSPNSHCRQGAALSLNINFSKNIFKVIKYFILELHMM